MRRNIVFHSGVRAHSDFNSEAFALSALEDLYGGAVLLLDNDLRVMAASPQAVALLGAQPAKGVSAPGLLCGDSPRRPVANALAEGRSITAVVPHPRRPGEVRLRVTTVPMTRGGRRSGWVLRLSADREAQAGPELFFGMWTNDPTMKQMFRIVERVARVDASVLVRGETGSGKELVAEALHKSSPRAKGPFRALNCAAMPAALLESELFGHVRGAFTGAVRDNAGHFRAADKGTLFLDEVAELPLDVQAKLLRVLESHTITPVGSGETIRVNVRVVAATHTSLRRAVEAGTFRADLMYRLRVIPIFLPPLRDRRGDVVLLAERFIEEMNARGGRQVGRLSAGAADLLSSYEWPGNVRELRNALEYAFAIGEGAVLVEADLPPELSGEPAGPRHPEPAFAANARATGAPAASERSEVVVALERAGGRRDEAARKLGISRITLWRRMRALGLLERAK
jgi:transcriptional regulator with PAS, ATPase and Fis domain